MRWIVICPSQHLWILLQSIQNLRHRGDVLGFGRRAGRSASRNELVIGESLAGPKDPDGSEGSIAQAVDELLEGCRNPRLISQVEQLVDVGQEFVVQRRGVCLVIVPP